MCSDDGFGAFTMMFAIGFAYLFILWRDPDARESFRVDRPMLLRCGVQALTATLPIAGYNAFLQAVFSTRPNVCISRFAYLGICLAVAAFFSVVVAWLRSAKLATGTDPIRGQLGVFFLATFGIGLLLRFLIHILHTR